jgi:uncharacterized protein (TIGR02145 family)
MKFGLIGIFYIHIMFKHSKLAYYVFLALAVQVLVSCSGKEEIDFFPQEVLDEMYAPFRSSSSVDTSSSSSAEQSSSSNEQGSSSSVEQSSSSDVSSSSIALSSSGIELSSSSNALCGGKPYTSSQFCLEDVVTNKCGGIQEYRADEFCYELNGVSGVYTLCGTKSYNPSTQFCLEGTRTDKCNGQTYTSSQFCYNDKSPEDRCGKTPTGDEYKPGEDCCGSKAYNPITHFCDEEKEVGEFCGDNPQKYYDPVLYKCKKGSNGIYLKEEIEYGGDTYDAVLIGDQIWIAKNLNYNTTSGSMCYGEDNSNYSELTVQSNCDKFGRLYDWAAAMGVCPDGWHLPSNNEWYQLVNYVNEAYCSDNKCAEEYLKSMSGWLEESYNGLDVYGFSALPGGEKHDNGDFYNRKGSWWSATTPGNDPNYAWCVDFPDDYQYMFIANPKSTSLRSVRCVKDD